MRKVGNHVKSEESNTLLLDPKLDFPYKIYSDTKYNAFTHIYYVNWVTNIRELTDLCNGRWSCTWIVMTRDIRRGTKKIQGVTTGHFLLKIITG